MPTSDRTVIHIVRNPVAGARSASDVLRSHLLPLLDGASNLDLSIVHHETSSPGGGAVIARDILEDVGGTDAPLYLVLLGGDGTTHEVLDGLYNSPAGKGKPPTLRLALVPTGTANALFASLYPPSTSPGESSGLIESQLRSVRSLLEALGDLATSAAEAVPLTLARTSYDRADPSSPSASMIAHLITSHALHAAILADSEALRAEHPGVDRFKIAAQQNMTRWVGGTLKVTGLSATPGQPKRVQRYDPDGDDFIDVEKQGEEVSLEGPFFYLACLSTDRLEPTFVPAPFSSTREGTRHARPPHALDLVVVRPTRDPLVRRRLTEAGVAFETSDIFAWWTSEEAQPVRESFAAERVGELTVGMYTEGKHVKLRYTEDGTDGLGYVGNGTPVVEYLRGTAYEFIPHSLDERARLTCIDGTIVDASRTECSILSGLAQSAFVYR